MTTNNDNKRPRDPKRFAAPELISAAVAELFRAVRAVELWELKRLEELGIV